MNPIYRFGLSGNGQAFLANPVWPESLAKEYERQSGEQFFRAKLSGKLTFKGDDFTFIVAQAFDTQFRVDISVSYDMGQSWGAYWSGTFWKTDCDINEDDKTVIVTPSVLDRYNDILAGMDKEYNLIDLTPEIVQIKADKRSMVQVYVPGQSVIGCFLSGMWWEQECEPESNETLLSETGDGKLNFVLNKTIAIASVSGDVTPSLPDIFLLAITRGFFNLAQIGTQDFPGSEYTLRYYFNAGSGGVTQRLEIFRNSDSQTLWRYQYSGADSGMQLTTPWDVVLEPVSGSGAIGNVNLSINQKGIYSRFVCDTETVGSVSTHKIGENDIVGNNRNYSRVVGYDFPETITYSSALSNTPTKWGIYQPGQYYQSPYSVFVNEFFPVARNSWGRISIWFAPSAIDELVEVFARREFIIRDAYPLSSVISVLLSQVAPGVTHEPNTNYSEFLYGTNIAGITQTLAICPKSNIMYAGYDQPAQKAPITLKNVTDMLRDCFRCYWFIDELNRFRIEHIQYFINGGSYLSNPVIGIDLTSMVVSRNGKPWAFAQNKYKFDKPEMSARYQFGWMDDVTEMFEGYPLDILANFVDREKVEQITVNRFSSDIDYIMLNPSTISKDGFVLLASTPINWEEKINSPIVYQNGGTIRTNIDLTAYRGALAKITVSTSHVYLGVSQAGAGFAQLIGETSNSQGTTTFEFVVNEMAEYIVLSLPNASGGTSVSSLQILLGEYRLPYVSLDNARLQNGYVAFAILQQYYLYDLPAYRYAINGREGYAYGVKKQKTQSVVFPALTDPNLLQLVKTNLGNGAIRKLSVNLSARSANATLEYDTE